MPLWKLVALTVFTLSFYHFVWFYRQWKRQRSVERCRPFWRAVFGPLFFHSLGSRIRQRREEAGLSPGFTLADMAICYCMFQLVWHLPDPWFFGGLLSFLPLLPVQHGINELNRHQGVPPEPALNAWTVVALILGAVLLLLVLIGSFLPEP